MLNDVNFKYFYSSGENEPVDFFFDALMNSSYLDLGLGYFSSSGFRALSMGFAIFIHKGGSMRFVINDSLSQEDKFAIQNGLVKSPEEIIENNLINSIRSLSKVLSAHDKHFFKCLSWLISTKKLELKAFMPKSERGGIVHQKFGIFKDKLNNLVAFNGSANFSKSALEHNLENITCHISWRNEESENERINWLVNSFNKIWTGKNRNIKQIPIDRIKTFIRDEFPCNNIAEIIEEGNEIIENSELSKKKKLLIKANLKNKELNVGDNKFTLYGRPAIKNPFELREYQKNAIKSWFDNNCIGLFEMATGTGKTITAINCMLEVYKAEGFLKAIIIVPTKDLVDQWDKELLKFGFTNIILAYSENEQWNKEILSNVNRTFNRENYFIVITTYNTYCIDKFQSALSLFDKDAFLLADEAHNFGTEKQISKHNSNITKRLALTATPARHFDEIGTDKLLKYFNSEAEPTFRFDLKDAIKSGFLTEYYYYPKIVYLLEHELEEYIEISKKIVKYFNFNGGNFKDDPILSSLLLKRKRIINKAQNKESCLIEILKELTNEKSLKYTLVYVPEGNENRFDNEDQSLIDEYSKIIRRDFNLSQYQFIGKTKNRNNILDYFSKGKISVLTAMKCLDEGIDVARTENAIFCASTSNPRQFIQRRGRVLRKHPDKKHSNIYDMVVVASVNYNTGEDYIKMEKKLFEAELSRVKDFASMSLNNYQSLKVFDDLAMQFNIELYK